MSTPPSDPADFAFGALQAQATTDPAELETVVESILGGLSLDERLAMMSGDLDFWPGLVEMLRGGYGHTPYVGGAVDRVGLPGIRFCDGPRGVTLGHSTCFPVSMARGATWDVDLEERIGAAIGGSCGLSAQIFSALSASMCSAIRPGVGHRRRTARTRTTSASSAQR